MVRPLLLLGAALAAGAAVLRRRQAQSETDALWREATADSSR